VRLVVEWTVEGNGYESNDCYYTVPAEYDSAEAFLLELERKLKDILDRVTKVQKLFSGRQATKEDSKLYSDTIAESNSGFELGGRVFHLTFFEDRGKITLPEVFELNEWFEHRMREERA
jgi:hypothetical protein